MWRPYSSAITPNVKPSIYSLDENAYSKTLEYMNYQH